MTAHQNNAFQQLLSAWRQHDDARHSDSITDLGNARRSLDSARNDMHNALSSIR